MTDEDHCRIVAALAQDHREELARAYALVVLYRETLEANGVEPPDMTGAMALERFQHVFLLAGHLDQVQHPELLADWWAGQRRREESISYGKPA